MRRFLTNLLIVVIVIGAVGYWRGWFSFTNAGKVDVQVDESKFKQDREDFKRSVAEKATAIKDKLARLWKHSEGLTGDEKARAQKELVDLNAQRDRLELQLRELDDAGPDRFEGLKHDLSQTLDGVEKRIDALTSQLEKVTVK